MCSSQGHSAAPFPTQGTGYVRPGRSYPHSHRVGGDQTAKAGHTPGPEQSTLYEGCENSTGDWSEAIMTMTVLYMLGGLLMATGAGIAGHAWTRREGNLSDVVFGMGISAAFFVGGLGIMGVLQ